MKNFDKHEFDEIFKAGLTAPDLNEVDEDWMLMKVRLQSQKRRKIIPYYLMLVSSIAAVMLMVFSVNFNSDKSGQQKVADKFIVEDKSAAVVTAANSAENELNSIPVAVESTIGDANLKSEENVFNNRFQSNTELINNIKIEPGMNFNVEDRLTQAEIAGIPAVPVEIDQPIADLNAGTNENLPVADNALLSSQVKISGPGIEEPAEQNLNPSKSRFSLAINFAPDVNGVEHLQSNKLSYSIGAGLIYQISDKLSVEAGAAYGKKSYQTGFSSFRPASYNLFQVKPNSVSSGFDVMDIQMNLAYTLLKKGKSSIGLGAGISSYLMLDEQYSFTYQNVNARGLGSFSTGYQNNHFFGIANLNLSYKRSLTNNLKLAFNPYLKLPLTDLGYGNIRLRSAGMSVGVIKNLNKAN